MVVVEGATRRPFVAEYSTMVVIGLILTPYMDRSPGGVGKWFSRERLLANTVFIAFVVLNVIFVIIGTFFRGPNWAFVAPW